MIDRILKGRAETDLLQYSNATKGVFRTLILRPGYFFPSDPVDARRLRSGFECFIDPIFGPIFRGSGLGIHAQDLGRASVAIAKGGEGIVGKGEYQELFRNSLLSSIAKGLNAKQKSL